MTITAPSPKTTLTAQQRWEQQEPPTAKTSSFSFYDIESLSNVFSLVVYTPHDDRVDDLEIFFLADDAKLNDEFDSDDKAEKRANELLTVIKNSNPGLPQTKTVLRDLHYPNANRRLAKVMGLSDADVVCDTSSSSKYSPKFRPVCDTDDDYDPMRHPFLTGYNSLNYDTTMLALYLQEAFDSPQRGQDPEPPTARTMRDHNDMLFSEQHIDFMPGALGWDGPAAKIRNAMIKSGRHLDVARLNEKSQKVALKRLLGMLGYQIKESEHLSHDTTINSLDEFFELLAYNVSDCLGLSQLFQDNAYAPNFDLKAGLLHQYGQTVFNKDGTVRRDRLTVDTSSAKFVGRILAPYKPLHDIRAVSYTYPDPQVAHDLGIEPTNVLDDCIAFFEENIAPDPKTHPDATPAQRKAHAQMMEVFAYYKDIEGRNFNDSQEYRNLYPEGPDADDINDIPRTPNNVPYFTAEAEPSTCFATFSYGGIHGAEYDQKSFQLEDLAYQSQLFMLQRAKIDLPDAHDFVVRAKDQHNLLHLPDGTTVDKRLVLFGSDPEKVKYRNPKKDNPVQCEQLERARELVPDAADLLATQRPEADKLDVTLDDGTVIVGKTVLANTTEKNAAYRDAPSKRPPELFVANGKSDDDRGTKLHQSFTHTSAATVTHEDFTSYYPNLLRNMQAFYNPELGEDRYAKIFFDKERYGDEIKGLKTEISRKHRMDELDPNHQDDVPDLEILSMQNTIERLTKLRNGTKLILNSASGAGDTTHKTPIRMNNVIKSMRIIGQLFSWRIGQAQAAAGARIVSTNTDGLYSVLDSETNDRILAEQSRAINVEIEPEPMALISKDSNNRLELVPPEGGTEETPVSEWMVQAAGGGTLGCYKGPNPERKLNHPAVLDFALARYLQAVFADAGEAGMSRPFDRDLGRIILEQAVFPDDPVATLTLFQNVIAASRGSITYPFAADPIDPETGVERDGMGNVTNVNHPYALQAINRVFIVRQGTPDAVSLLNAGAWKVTPASQKRRRELHSGAIQRDPLATGILRKSGWATTYAEAEESDGLTMLPDDQDVTVRKINSIDETWPMVVINDDLHTLSWEQQDRLITALDFDIYLQMLEETFTANWKNV